MGLLWKVLGLSMIGGPFSNALLNADDNPEGMLPKVSHVGIDDGEDEEFEILEADSEEENDPDVDESGDEGENHMTGMEFDMLDDMDEDDEE